MGRKILWEYYDYVKSGVHELRNARIMVFVWCEFNLLCTLWHNIYEHMLIFFSLCPLPHFRHRIDSAHWVLFNVSFFLSFLTLFLQHLHPNLIYCLLSKPCMEHKSIHFPLGFAVEHSLWYRSASDMSVSLASQRLWKVRGVGIIFSLHLENWGRERLRPKFLSVCWFWVPSLRKLKPTIFVTLYMPKAQLLLTTSGVVCAPYFWKCFTFAT